MISFALNHISWMMVIVAAIVGFIISMLWYSPFLFGNTWLRLSGIKISSSASMTPYLINEFVGLLLQSYMLAWLLENVNALEAVDALIVAAMVSVLFIGVNQWCGIVWSQRPRELFFVYQGSTLVTYLAMAALFAYVAA